MWKYHEIKSVKFYKTVRENMKYVGTTIENQNWIAEQVKIILNAGNSCYDSFRILISSGLLFKNYT